MNKLTYLLLTFLMVFAASANASVLVFSSNGAFVAKTNLAAFNTASDCVGKTAVVTSPQTLTGNVVKATDREIRFERGGKIVHNAYKLTGLKEVNARAFGFDESASATANANAIQDAIVAVGGSTGGKVNLPGGIFAVAPDIISTVGAKGVTISGISSGYGYVISASGTHLTFTAGSIGINMYDDDGLGSGGTLGTLSFNNSIKNLVIDGAGVLNEGIKLNGNQVIEDVGTTRCVNYGIHLANMTNSALLNRVSSTSNTAGLGFGLFVDGALTTVYKVSNSNFRLNKKGVSIHAGSGFVFDHIVSESNTEEALYMYKADSPTPLFHGTFNHFWAENSWYGNGAGGYSVVIDSYSASDPARWLVFNTLNINATSNTGKHLLVNAGNDIDFYNADMLAGNPATGALLNSTYAARIYFHGGQLLSSLYADGNTGAQGALVSKGGTSSPFGGYESSAGYSVLNLRVFRYADNGGISRRVAYASANITASSSVTIPVNVPSGARLLGCQIRVDTAMDGADTWDAAYGVGASQSVVSGGVGGSKNVKINAMYDENLASPITTGTTTVVISKHGGGTFTATGTLSAWVYYEVLETIGNAP